LISTNAAASTSSMVKSLPIGAAATETIAISKPAEAGLVPSIGSTIRSVRGFAENRIKD
jgi:hypothetical protein